MAKHFDLDEQLENFKSVATMLAFSVPHVGGGIGAIIAGAGIVWNLVATFPANTNPLAQMPVEADLVQLRLDLIDAIGKAFVQKDLDDAMQAVVDWHGLWEGAEDWSSHDKGLTYLQQFTTAQDEQTWIDDKNKILRNPLTPDSSGFRPMLQQIEVFQNATGSRLKTVGLYVAAVNVFMLYCRSNMIWDYTLLIREHGKLQLLTDQERSSYASKMLAYNAANPKVGPPPQLPPAIQAILDEPTAQKQSPWIRLMVDELGGPEVWRQALLAGKSAPDPDPQSQRLPSKMGSHVFLANLIDIRNEVRDVLAAVTKEISDRASNVNVSFDQGTQTWSWVDTKISAQRQDGYADMARAQVGQQTYIGQLTAAIWDRDIVQKGYGDYSPTVMTDLDEIIVAWQKALTGGAAYLDSFDGVSAPPIYDT